MSVTSTPTPTPTPTTAQPERPRPRATRRRGIGALSDHEARAYTAKEIIAAAKATWRSRAYGHYGVALEEYYDHEGNFVKYIFVFWCKYKDPDHDPIHRDRLRTGDGTHSLLISADACDRRRGVPVGGHPGSVSGPLDLSPDTTYSHELYLSLLAIECARDHRPFSSVTSEVRRAEAQLLRPGTELPTAATISNYVRRIYTGASVDVAQYLQNTPGALHLAVDGWTCPTSESYLGVVVFWLEGQRMWRAILEFIRLTESHTGDYMARRIHECLKRYKIEHKLRAICLDNASNNNTLVQQLGNLVPTFRGPYDRIRCVPHILNLMAKAFMALLDTPSTRARVTAGDGASTSSAEAAALAEASGNGDDPSKDPQDSNNEVDPGKLQHDTGVVQNVAAQAIEHMKGWATTISDSELASSRQVIPKIAGLARRVNDSPTLEELFRDLVEKDPELQGNACALPRYVVTCWNSYRSAVSGHLRFKGPVQWLTGKDGLNLKKYALTEEQWKLARQLGDVLEVFQEPTDYFSRATVPLIHEVLPQLLALRSRLFDIRDDAFKQDLSPVIRAGAEAALLVFDKYIGSMGESDFYTIAIVMCPDRKLKWFSDRNYTVEPVRDQAIARFAELFPEAAHSQQASAQTRPHGGNLYTQRHSSSSSSPVQPDIDSIHSYLETPIVSSDVLREYGGVIPYWNAQLDSRPCLARMALDYLTAPASSVDAERAFSSGRLMINHLQHQMSAGTFQSQMAIGSWFGTPLLPDLSSVASIVKANM